jgi:hypothetical protein
MKRWFIPTELLDSRYNCTVSGDWIRLWSKNTMSFSWWRIVRKAANNFGYIVERGWCPRYWSKVIEPFTD